MSQEPEDRIASLERSLRIVAWFAIIGWGLLFVGFYLALDAVKVAREKGREEERLAAWDKESEEMERMFQEREKELMDLWAEWEVTRFGG